ncbi:MAG: hypothetical protein V1899_07030 [Planctomycetota bacterium]
MLELFQLRPNWVRQTGLISVVLPEPPVVQKYCGAQRTDVEEQYDMWLSDATLDSLSQNGVNLIWIRLFAGFGLQFEKSEAERAQDYIARAHSHGLKIAALISLGALVPETLLLEESECPNWLQINAAGWHPTCATPYSFRARPCYNSENFLRYMERVCNQAMDFDADLIHFDDIGYNPEPDVCRCPICVAAFRDFLYKQYGAQEDRTQTAGQKRFGHNDFTHIRPPFLTREILADQEQAAQVNGFDTPHIQEWIIFKAHTVTQALARFEIAIRKRKPECAIGADLFHSFGGNTDWLHGIDFDRQLPMLDMVRFVSTIDEGDDRATDGALSTAHCSLFTGHCSLLPRALKRAREAPGQLDLFATETASDATTQEKPLGLLPTLVVSGTAARNASFLALARAMKTARAFNLAFEAADVKVMGAPRPSAADIVDVETALGLSLTFNPTGLSSIGTGLIAPNLIASATLLRAYLDFYLQHKQALLLGAQSLATVAVFCDTASLMFDHAETHSRFNWLLNLLLERNLGFEMLYSHQLAELSRFRCVVLSHSISLTDEQVLKFERFVSEGGGIVVLKNVGERDHWRRMRSQPALAALLGKDYTQAFQREVGKGRVVFVPENVAGVANHDYTPFSRTEVINAIRFAAGGNLPLHVDCPSGSVLTEAAKTADGELILHAVNLQPKTARSVRCSLACVRSPQQVVPLSPGKSYEPLPFQWDNGRIFFGLNALERYILFRITTD